MLVGTGLLAAGVRWRAARGRRGAVGVAVLAAAGNVLARVSGPPFALWAANAGWPARQQRASLQAVFLGLNLVALPSLGAPSGRGRAAGRDGRCARSRRGAGACPWRAGCPSAERSGRPWRWPGLGGLVVPLRALLG